MKKLLLLALAGAATLPALARTDVGVTIGINEPGVYGQVTLGDYGPPAVIYSQPVIITREARYADPVYMYVPVEQQRHWRNYCAQYRACGRPVYFVREDWVRQRWEHEHARGRDHDNGRHWGRDRDRGNAWERDDHRGERERNHEQDRGWDRNDRRDGR